MHYNRKILKTDLECYINTASQAENKDFHMHDSYEIYLFLDGDIDYFVEDHRYHLIPGDLLIFNDRDIHKSTNLTGMPHKRYILHFNPAIILPLCTNRTNLLACFQRTEPNRQNLIHLKGAQLQEVYTLFKQISHSLENPGYGEDTLALSDLIRLLVSVNRHFNTLSAAVPRDMDIITQIMRYIQENLTNNLSLDQIAGEFLIDKCYLCRIFKKATGSTIYQYILINRINLAQQALQRGESVSSACEAAGFSDYANFIRSFKKIIGVPPGQYKKDLLLKEQAHIRRTFAENTKA